MITIKSAEEIGKMRRAGALLHQVLEELRKLVEPGVTTAYIDEVAEKLIRDGGAIPSSKGYEGFPSSICASVNDEVVHGFPSKRVLKEGDLLSIDCTLLLDGWQSDSAFSVAVGKASPETERLIRVTEECFWIGLDKARAGNRIGDIGHAVQEHAEKNGYGVIRDLCGHGIGREMHEDPSVPNFGTAGRGVRLRPGMVFTIEPMIARGRWPIYVDDNGWTIITRDHSWCSHYEHTLVVTEGDPEILSWPDAPTRRFPG
jgi:methionyl aminopeptidase